MADRSKKVELGLDLDSEGLENAARSAAGALDQLRETMDADVKALAGMQKAMRNLQMGSVVNVDQYRKLKLGIDAKKESIAKAQSAYLKLGGELTKTTPKAKVFRDQTESVTRQLHGLPGPLGQASTRLEMFQKLLSPKGALGLAAAIVVLVGAVASAIVMLTRYGLAQADARRNEMLRLEALTKLRFWYQRIPGNAKEMQASIDRVSASVASSRDELVGYNEHLYKLGLRGKNLDLALEAFATAKSVGADQAAEWFAGMAATAQIAGGSVKRLADDIKARFGEIAARQMLSLDVQLKKLRENFGRLFDDLKVEPFFKAFKSLTDLFSQSTATGRALKALLTTLLQPVLGVATSGAPVLKRFFQGIVLEALKLTNAVLEIALLIKKTIGPSTGDWDGMKNAFIVGRVVTLALALAFAFLAGNVIAATWPFLLAAAAIYAVINTARLLYELWDEIDWSGMGKAIWEGIVNGLKAGVNAVTSVASDLADEVSKAFKQALGISSPSKVFARLGIEIPRGIAVGVNAGAHRARASVADVVPPMLDVPAIRPTATPFAPAPTTVTTPRVGAPSEIAAPAASAPAARGIAGATFNFGDIVIHGAELDKPKEVALDLRREIERMFESVALELGAPVAGEGTA